MTDMDKKDKLLILVVSDTHENINNINLLVEIFEKKPKKPDYIFLLGDIVTLNKETKTMKKNVKNIMK